MGPHRKALTAAASFVALVLAGSAASAIGTSPLLPVPPFITRLAEQARQVQAQALAATAAAADPFGGLPGAGFAAFATGTASQVDPELRGDDIDAQVTLANSNAAYSSGELAALTDELGQPVSPRLAGGSAAARGRAINIDPPDDVPASQLFVLDPAEAKAPPTAAPVIKSTNLSVRPFAEADTFGAEAAARAIASGCVIGDDLARGKGVADDTDVADFSNDPKSRKPVLSVSAGNPEKGEPERAVSQSLSRARLYPLDGAPGRFGVESETRQTIAPVTFLLPGDDEDNAFTIEVAGEWTLRARSDGTGGDLTMGAEPTSADDIPMLRVVRNGAVIAAVEPGQGPVEFPLLVDGEPVGTIQVGERPRAIAGALGSAPTKTGSRVTGAVDIASVRLTNPSMEVRVGHMEAGVAVPAGGVSCPGIKLTKQSEPGTVQAGDKFSWTVSVSNPNDCLLDQVEVLDSPVAADGVSYRFLTTLPKASAAPGGGLVFHGIGPIQAGASQIIRINSEVDASSKPGTIVNRATAGGICGAAPMTGAANATTNVVAAPPAPAVEPPAAPAPVPPAPPVPQAPKGAAPVRGPAQVGSGAVEETAGAPRGGGALPTTGRELTALVALGAGLAAGGSALRRARRRSRPA